jgi:alpha-L-fucosidase
VKVVTTISVTLIMASISFGSETLAASSSEPASSPPAIPYSTIQFISSADSDTVVAEKAAKVLPRPNQTDWMRLERTFFIHFGPNTFRGVEWGSGQESPSVFNPTAFDADQWLRAIKDAGGQMVILVCKHHDGLCLWQTRYTDHSVASSPWRGGKGDEVRDVANAARKYGVKLGVYLSPADLYQLTTNPTNPHGYYGNASAKLPSVIPTDPASFPTDPTKSRAMPRGFKSYTYDVDDYNRYFLNQLYELLTEYGPIDDVWFDGANPDPSVHEKYDYAAWYDLIRHLQPQAVITVKGPDVRWVGNEGGVGRSTEWSVIPLSSPPDTFTWPDMHDNDLGGRDKLVPGSYLWWYPAEVNAPILYGWFWAAGKPVRTADDLVNMYYESVGRNGNWLLNLSPDTRGLIPDNELAPLRTMARVIEETFAKNLAAGGELSADSSNAANPPSLALDNNLDTWWEAASGQTTAVLTLKLPKPVTFDVVSLQEAVDHRGQRVESFCVDVWDGLKWNQVEQQTTIGHKRLLRLDSPAMTGTVRIRITASRLEPTLAEIGLFKQVELVQPPVISSRDVNGLVSINSPKGLPVLYTTDDSLPSPKSTVYAAPISLPSGGTIHAACLGHDNQIGMIAATSFSGFAPTGWRVIPADNPIGGQTEDAANAVDGDPSTLWLTSDSKSPHVLTVDMGHDFRIGGVSYLPRQDGDLTGVVDEFSFESSIDGIDWTTDIDHGHFGNIKNNPVMQQVLFAPVTARFFRFTVYQDINGMNYASAAEISVLPAPTKQ